MVQQQDRIVGLVGTLGMKAPVVGSTAANRVLYGAVEQFAVDGTIFVKNGDRVLLLAQTNPIENGIWIIRDTEWERAADFDGTRDVMQGTVVPVGDGTNRGRTLWMLTTPNPIIGTTPLVFVQITGTTSTGGGGSNLVVSPFMQTMLDDVDASVARGTIQAANIHGSPLEYFSASDLIVASAMYLPNGSVVNPQGFLGLGNNNPLSWLHVADINTTSTRHAARVERVTNHTGGAGNVAAALQVLNIVNAATTGREFGVYATLDNYSGSNYNISGYFAAVKRAAGNTQGLGVEVADATGVASPTGLLNAFTASVRANGLDGLGTRIAMEIAIGRANLGGASLAVGTGLRIGTFDGEESSAYYTTGLVLTDDMQTALMVQNSGAHAIQGIWDSTNKPMGIKLSGTYSIGAIVMNAGGKLLFDPQGACISANIAFKDIVGFENCWVNFQQGFGVTSGATNISASAIAGNSGALPSQTSGYLKFKIDGATYKIPYYN